MVPEYDPQEAEIVKTLDKRVIPLLACAQWVILMTRGNLDFARTDLAESLELEEWQIQWSMAGMAIGSSLVVFPTTYAMRYVYPSRWIAGLLVISGFFCFMMAMVGGWEGLLTLRILFGLAQAGVLPSVMLFTTYFFINEERALRLSWIIGSATCAAMFSPFLARAFQNLNGLGGVDGWRWMFILEGLPTIATGVMIWRLLPDFPETTQFLSVADRLVAATRVIDDADPDPPTHLQARKLTRMPSHLNATENPPAAPFRWIQIYDTFVGTGYFHLLAVAFWACSVCLDALTDRLGPDIGAGTFTNHSGVTEGSFSAGLVVFAVFAIAGMCSVSVAKRADRAIDRGGFVVAAMAIAAFGFLVMAVVPTTSWTPLNSLNAVLEQESTSMLPSSVLNVTRSNQVNSTSTAEAQSAFDSGLSLSESADSHSMNATHAHTTVINTYTSIEDLIEENNDLAENANLAEGGDGGVLTGALHLLGLMPAAVGLISATPCILASAMEASHGTTAKATVVAWVMYMAASGLGSSLLVPLSLFPLWSVPEEGAQGVATWGLSYATGAWVCFGICLAGCLSAAGAWWMALTEKGGLTMMSFNHMRSGGGGMSMGISGGGPTFTGLGHGLRRLMNDAEEKGAWAGDSREGFASLEDINLDAGGNGGWGAALGTKSKNSGGSSTYQTQHSDGGDLTNSDWDIAAKTSFSKLVVLRK